MTHHIQNRRKEILVIKKKKEKKHSMIAKSQKLAPVKSIDTYNKAIHTYMLEIIEYLCSTN